MQINHIYTNGFYMAIYGMRLPKNSEKCIDSIIEDNNFILGKNDEQLCLKLIKAGRDHRKFLRMIHVQAFVSMPISWWIQYDTYKVGTVANSRSRMHKFGERNLSMSDFYLFEINDIHNILINKINEYLQLWRATHAQSYWYNALNLLPMSYLQDRVIDLNYEVLITIIKARYNEKLKNEWQYFCNSFLKNCPYLKSFYEIIL